MVENYNNNDCFDATNSWDKSTTNAEEDTLGDDRNVSTSFSMTNDFSRNVISAQDAVVSNDNDDEEETTKNRREVSAAIAARRKMVIQSTRKEQGTKFIATIYFASLQILNKKQGHRSLKIVEIFMDESSVVVERMGIKLDLMIS